MNTKALRQKILDLAIRGRLVPQDPNDEPASVLLERIRAEKERLIKEGKIKRPKKAAASDTPHYENVPFEVPSSWEWCKLEEVISIRSGDSINVRALSNIGVYPVYGGNGIAGKYYKNNVQADTIVIGRVGFYCGSIHKTESPSWVTDNALIVTNYGLHVDFLFFLLQWLDLRRTSNSTAQPVVSGKGILPLIFPLPPLPEQHRIVAEIEKWFALIDEIETEQKDLATLIEQAKSKVLDLAIHGKLVPQDPADEPAEELLRRINPQWQPYDTSHYENLPQGWCITELGKLCQLSNGEKETGQRIYFDAKYLRGKAQGTFLTSGNFVRKGDYVILVDGENSGEVFVIPEDGYMGSTFKRLIMADGMYWPYVLYFIMFHKNILRNSKKGAAIPHLNKELFKSLTIGIPPFAEQQRIVNRITELFASLDSISHVLTD